MDRSITGSEVRWLIVMAASSGGVQALRAVLSQLPTDLPAAIVVVQHRPADGQSELPSILGRCTRLPVRLAGQGDVLEPGTIYLARPDSHLTVTPDHAMVYRDGSRIRFVRSSANPLFESAAKVFDRHVVAVVLSGCGRDATNGVQGVKAHGGLVIAQDQATAEQWDMPRSAIESGAVDYVLPVEAIAPAIDDIVHGRPIAAGTGVP
jgi:two-component system, chemotaxis family, protein-glutamate methylesterase/glutaminase